MYKFDNFKPKSLSPHSPAEAFREGGVRFIKSTAERLIPFLIIAATFVWLWK